MFFKKKRKSGGHGSHWQAALPGEDLEKSGLKEIVMESVSKGKIAGSTHFSGEIGSGELAVHEKRFDGLSVTTLSLSGNIGTSFPSIPTSQSYPAEIVRCEEWANGVEAQAEAQVFGATLGFFATDYALKREAYKEKAHAEVCLSALAYKLRVGSLAGTDAGDGKKFDENFTAMLPAALAFKDQGFDTDDYHVSGIVENARPATFAGQKGLLLKTNAITERKWKIVIDIGVLSKNIEGPAPKKGDKITALVWLTGRIK